MKILFGNQKGGVGKTTLCTLTANYISALTDYKLTVLDFDFQLSLYNEFKRKEDSGDMDLPYKVHSCPLNSSSVLLESISNLEDNLIFIDSPGKLDDKNILDLISRVNVIVIPFGYEKKTFESTYSYIQVVEKINPDVKIIMVPNKIKSTMRYHIKERADQVLRVKGTLLEIPIPDLASLMRTNIYELNKGQQALIQPLADIVLNNFIHTAAVG